MVRSGTTDTIETSRSHWPHCQGTRQPKRWCLGSRICSCALLARCAPQLLARRWTWSWTRVRMTEDGQLEERNSLLCRVYGQASFFAEAGTPRRERGVEIRCTVRKDCCSRSRKSWMEESRNHTDNQSFLGRSRCQIQSLPELSGDAQQTQE